MVEYFSWSRNIYQPQFVLYTKKNWNARHVENVTISPSMLVVGCVHGKNNITILCRQAMRINYVLKMRTWQSYRIISIAFTLFLSDKQVIFVETRFINPKINWFWLISFRLSFIELNNDQYERVSFTLDLRCMVGFFEFLPYLWNPLWSNFIHFRAYSENVEDSCI